MKKFINRPENAVEEMLDGLAVLNPGLIRLPAYKVLVRAEANQIRSHHVALISGGGSGHEPAHAGYVGAGMLTAAVAGEVFTSPDSDSIFAAIQAVAGAPGALLIVKNYTGDRLNFGVAAEMARAEGIPVETVLVADDVALRGTENITGARGLAGTVFIHKITGAAAAEGGSLAEVAATARAAASSLATMGVSLSAGTAPSVGRPGFELGDDEMELGLGIHGEPGVTRNRLQPADELTGTLLTEILKYGNYGSERRVAVMINNLGATTAMELAIVARRVTSFLERAHFTVERIYAGTFLSSLDMAGISISLLGVDNERLRLLDAPTTAPAWPNVLKSRPGNWEQRVPPIISSNAMSPAGKGAQTESGRRTRQVIEAACDSLIQAESALTEMDRITGDGDLGASMRRAAAAVLAVVESYPLDDAAATLKTLAHKLQHELGGTSGPLYGVLFLRCGSVLQKSGEWAIALAEGCRAIGELGGAKPGDRTMLDALYPFVQFLNHAPADFSRETLRAAAAAAKRGADSTARMSPRVGRSSYLGERVLGHPDPGAQAVAIWLQAVSDALFATETAAAMSAEKRERQSAA